jgi:hypothetical protein
MSLLGLELSDVGIIVAAADPERLLTVDEQDVESPGFALPGKEALAVGRSAERQAHLYPRQVIDRFWDQLDTQPLERPNPYAENHAEVAFEHLAHIWKEVKNYGNELVIAVPGFFSPSHMGMILGITRELSIPVRGFVAQAVVASPEYLEDGLLLHLDIHLHRVEVTCLERGNRLIQKETLSAEGNGLIALYKEWVNAIAEEFVRATRFDPLHQAVSEQELYDRLPALAEQLDKNPFADFGMSSGSSTYHATLTQDILTAKSDRLFRDISSLIDRLCKRYGGNEPSVILLCTHRVVRLPGMIERLASREGCQIIELERGRCAFGALKFCDPLSTQQVNQGVPFLTSRPRSPMGRTNVSPVHGETNEFPRPTHILYRSIAYPISESPLSIVLKQTVNGPEIAVQGQGTDVSQTHCSIALSGRDVVLTDHNGHGTFVDEVEITSSRILQLGQTIRVGTSGEKLQLIACRDSNERTKRNHI